MRQEGFYLASESIAQRAGVTNTRYKTPDGKYVLSEKDLRRVNFSIEEYATGLDVEVISEGQAKELVKKGTLNVPEDVSEDNVSDNEKTEE